jgi:hypothetical protein
MLILVSIAFAAIILGISCSAYGLVKSQGVVRVFYRDCLIWLSLSLLHTVFTSKTLYFSSGHLFAVQNNIIEVILLGGIVIMSIKLLLTGRKVFLEKLK